MQVRETNAARAISAAVILKGSRYVGRVQVHHGKSGTVQVDIWQDHAAACRSHDAALKATGKPLDNAVYQRGRAGGYGYDKLTAALSGLYVDGHKLTDHCEESRIPPKGAAGWPHGFKPPRGWHLSNFRDGYWGSLYREPGLKYLEALGYSIYWAI